MEDVVGQGFDTFTKVTALESHLAGLSPNITKAFPANGNTIFLYNHPLNLFLFFFLHPLQLISI